MSQKSRLSLPITFTLREGHITKLFILSNCVLIIFHE